MEILFVVDSVKDIEHKISLLENCCGEFKFFVNSKHVADIVKNKFIVDRVVGIYSNNEKATIDKYLQSENYKPTATILYYSSAKIDLNMINEIRENLKLNPNVIYIKKKFNIWDKIKFWFYDKFIKMISGMEDAKASIKLQYLNEESMEVLARTSFKNHIFDIPNALTIELDKENVQSYYSKSKFNPKVLYNPIVMCLIAICYVIVEKAFNLYFWVYLLVIASLIITIINWVVMVAKNTFDERYKK
ncbi:MAG: hypothetical protein ACLRFE_03575 [Clostridia bacterium]